MGGTPRCKEDRILKNSVSNNGYLFTTLYKNGIPKLYRIHRLVMENFNPVENMKSLEVNHLDEDITNNCLNNLEWCTRQENLNYGHRAENYIKTRGHKVRCIETGKIYQSLREAERDTGCAHAHIAECAKGLREHCKKLHWEYVNI